MDNYQGRNYLYIPVVVAFKPEPCDDEGDRATIMVTIVKQQLATTDRKAFGKLVELDATYENMSTTYEESETIRA